MIKFKRSLLLQNQPRDRWWCFLQQLKIRTPAEHSWTNHLSCSLIQRLNWLYMVLLNFMLSLRITKRSKRSLNYWTHLISIRSSFLSSRSSMPKFWTTWFIRKDSPQLLFTEAWNKKKDFKLTKISRKASTAFVSQQILLVEELISKRSILSSILTCLQMLINTSIELVEQEDLEPREPPFHSFLPRQTSIF